MGTGTGSSSDGHSCGLSSQGGMLSDGARSSDGCAPADSHLKEACHQMRPGPQMGAPADCHLEEVCHQMGPGPWEPQLEEHCHQQWEAYWTLLAPELAPEYQQRWLQLIPIFKWG
jgi:hypothetical protein